MARPSVMSTAAADAPALLGATWWDALEAVGTLLAVLVAVGAAVHGGVRARRAERSLAAERAERLTEHRWAVAALVAATIDIVPEPSHDCSRYVQRAHLQLANESAEPVFNVHVVVGVSDPPIPIGTLAVPVPLPVLPAHRSRTWDVTLALMAHAPHATTLSAYPTTEIFFTDSRGVRWHRQYDGRLAEANMAPSAVLREVSADNEAQLGNFDNPFNPSAVALGFLAVVTAPDQAPTLDLLRPVLAPNAGGWEQLADSELSALAVELREYGYAAHVWYPAPQVAWVRLIHQDDAYTVVSAGGFREVRAKILTLCFLPALGWRVFSVGATEPDWIEFPPGALTGDPRESKRQGDDG